MYEQPTKYLVSSSDYLDSGFVPVLTAGKSFILGYSNEKHGVYDKGNVIIFDDFTTDSKYVHFLFKAKSSAMKMLTPKTKDSLWLIFTIMQNLSFDIGEHKRHWISEYSQLEIDLPEKNEQERIVSVLSTIDDEIATKESLINKKRAIKTGVMQQLLTGKTRLVEV